MIFEIQVLKIVLCRLVITKLLTNFSQSTNFSEKVFRTSLNKNVELVTCFSSSSSLLYSRLFQRNKFSVLLCGSALVIGILLRVAFKTNERCVDSVKSPIVVANFEGFPLGFESGFGIWRHRHC